MMSPILRALLSEYESASGEEKNLSVEELTHRLAKNMLKQQEKSLKKDLMRQEADFEKK